MFAPPRYEIYTKNDQKSPHFYLQRSKSVPFFQSKATAISTSSYVKNIRADKQY